MRRRRQRRVELAEPRQHRRRGDDRVDALLRHRPVRGAPVHRDLRPHEPLVGDHDLAVRRLGHDRRVGAQPGGQHLLDAEARVLLVGHGRDDHVRVRARAASRHASSAAASPAFMSYAPRPYSRSPSTRGTNGSVIPSTPTVSRCPHSSSVGPEPPGSATTTLGRGAVEALDRRGPRRRPKPRRTRRSRPPPRRRATSAGFTESIATSSEVSDVTSIAGMMHGHERRARSGGLPAAPLRRHRRGRRPTASLLRVSGELDLVSEPQLNQRARADRRPRRHARPLRARLHGLDRPAHAARRRARPTRT